ncbi:hypothetical protein [Thermococcus sp.]
MFRRLGIVFIFAMFFLLPGALAYQFSGGGIEYRLSVSGGKSDAFVLLSVAPLDYVECLNVNWSEDLFSQCYFAQSFYQTYVLYVNRSGVFFVGRYLEPTWFFYYNGTWVMAKTNDYKKYTLYHVLPSLRCITPLNRTIVGEERFTQILQNSTLWVKGRVGNDSVVFGDQKIPVKDIRPYLWLNKEVYHLNAVPLGREILIYPPIDYMVFLRKNGSFSLFSHPSSEIHINGTLHSLKPVTIFLYDGKKLTPFPFYYLIYDVDLKKQRIMFMEEFCTAGKLNLTLKDYCLPVSKEYNLSSSAGIQTSTGQCLTIPRKKENEDHILVWILIVGFLSIIACLICRRKQNLR